MAEKPTGQKSDHPWPLSVISREWPHVKKAPFSFVVCVLAVGGLLCWAAFWLSQMFNEATISAQAATIAQLSLRPESVPIEQQTMKNLEDEVSKFEAKDAAQTAMEWPPLTAEEISRWVSKLRPSGLKTIIFYWGPDIEAKALYKSVKEVAKQLNIEMEVGLGTADKAGVQIIASKSDTSAQIIGDLFKEKLSGLNQDVSLTLGDSPGGKPTGQVMIFMGEKK